MVIDIFHNSIYANRNIMFVAYINANSYFIVRMTNI